MGDRCNGRCCQAFVLGGMSREEIQRSYDNTMRLETGGLWDWIRPDGLYWNHGLLVEGILRWWPWMIYLGRFKWHPVTGRETIGDPDGLDFFTCSKLSEDGNCLAYENRPHFCESYGVTTACEHGDCQWDGAWKEGEPRPLTPLQRDILSLKCKEYYLVEA